MWITGFQIIDTDLWKDGKMRHDALMAGILENLTPQIITDLYNGKSPHKMNLTSKQLIYATNLWAAFIEQEVNWGSNIFQLHTHFGDTRYMYMKDKWENGKKCEYLEKAVPRDYFCSHIFALFSVLEHDLSNIDTIVNKWKKTYMRTSKRGTTVKHCIDAKERIKPTYRDFMLSHSNDSVKKWITPHIKSVERACTKLGINSKWNDYYQLENNAEVSIKYPLLVDGQDWPTILLNGWKWVEDE